MRRSFRAHPYPPSISHGCTLGWYAFSQGCTLGWYAFSQGCTLGWYALTLWVKRAVFSEVAHAVHGALRSGGRCQQGSWAGPIGGERLLLGASYATPALVRHAQRLRQRRGRRRWKRSWEQRSTRHVTSRKCDGRLSAPVARCCGGACRFLAGARSCRCARRGLSRRGDAPRFFDRCPREASRSLHGWLVAGGTGVGGSGTSVGATHFVDAPRSACRAAPSSKLKPQAPTTGLAVRNCRPPDGDWCPRTSTTAYLVADM